jgi:hypothetical protein
VMLQQAGVVSTSTFYFPFAGDINAGLLAPTHRTSGSGSTRHGYPRCLHMFECFKRILESFPDEIPYKVLPICRILDAGAASGGSPCLLYYCYFLPKEFEDGHHIAGKDPPAACPRDRNLAVKFAYRGRAAAAARTLMEWREEEWQDGNVVLLLAGAGTRPTSTTATRTRTTS